jgi:hypothetical protein
MSMQVIRHEVVMMLSQANMKISEAEQIIAAGSDRERIDAAGELFFLKRQKETLQQRLAEIETRADAPTTLYEWIKEEVFNLNLRLESWIAHG